MTNYVKKIIRDGVEYEVAGGGDTTKMSHIFDLPSVGTDISEHLNVLSSGGEVVYRTTYEGGSEIFCRVYIYNLSSKIILAMFSMSGGSEIYNILYDENGICTSVTKSIVPGLPSGGTVGQVLTKTSTGSEWKDNKGGGYGILAELDMCNTGSIAVPYFGDRVEINNYNDTGTSSICKLGGQTLVIPPTRTGTTEGKCWSVTRNGDCLCICSNVGGISHHITYYGEVSNKETYADVLIVGGGGGGGCGYGSGSSSGYRSQLGGGGGAGGFIECQHLKIGTGIIKVGSGGCYWCKGQDSAAFGITAYGGGHGAGGTGGSGGGGRSGGSGGAAIDNTQGNNGGAGYVNGLTCYGGGGGGAGSAGGNASSTGCANGGIGKQSDISGELCYYAGGGGGATDGVGGLGGGGNYNSAATYYGGGGGGMNCGNYKGNGYQGVVILRYKTDGSCGISPESTGGCKYECGEYTIHCFCDVGAFKFNLVES